MYLAPRVAVVKNINFAQYGIYFARVPACLLHFCPVELDGVIRLDRLKATQETVQKQMYTTARSTTTPARMNMYVFDVDPWNSSLVLC